MGKRSLIDNAGTRYNEGRLMETLFHLSFETQFGWMRPVSNGRHLVRLDWDQQKWPEPDKPDDVSRETYQQLSDYLTGSLKIFSVPLSPAGKSDAGRWWLQVMARIPYGEVWTYKEFANAAGMPKAARAAGSSCASNPIPIIYPCHRVVKADRTLGNYGGGSRLDPQHPENLDRKAALIALEQGNLIRV